MASNDSRSFLYILVLTSSILCLCGQSYARRVATPCRMSIADIGQAPDQVAAAGLSSEPVGTTPLYVLNPSLNPVAKGREALEDTTMPTLAKPRAKPILPKPQTLVFDDYGAFDEKAVDQRSLHARKERDGHSQSPQKATKGALSKEDIHDGEQEWKDVRQDPLHGPVVTGDTANYTYSFEVLRPVVPPSGATACRVSLMTDHLFADNPPPFETTYVPPTKCGESWSQVALTWSANVRGRQFDRIAAVFFDGLEVLRTTTEEPSATGVKWAFDTDITRFAAFLKEERQVSVSMGNVVDQTYTGIYNVSVSLTFYSGPTPSRYADVIIPIGSGDSGFAAFALSNGTNLGTKVLSHLPRNVYRAQVEVVPSQTANDEFYWGNPPTEYVASLPGEYQGDFLGGGVYREVQAYLDGVLLGGIWQYPVIYTGGGNPYWWRPVVGIGAFVVPTYTLEITPFVGMLVDGASHTVGLAVDGVLTGGVWYVSGALHLWLDEGAEQTTGSLLTYQVAPSVTPSVTIDFLAGSAVDANITTRSHRSTLVRGSVATSFGTFTSTVRSTQTLHSLNQILEGASVGTTAQRIAASADARMEAENGTVLYAHEESFDFPLFVSLRVVPSSDGVNFVEYGRYSHGFSFNKSTEYPDGEVYTETQINVQRGGGIYSSSVPGRGYSYQNFSYVSNFQGCYSRAYHQSDLIFAYDNITTTCN